MFRFLPLLVLIIFVGCIRLGSSTRTLSGLQQQSREGGIPNAVVVARIEASNDPEAKSTIDLRNLIRSMLSAKGIENLTLKRDYDCVWVYKEDAEQAKHAIRLQGLTYGYLDRIEFDPVFEKDTRRTVSEIIAPVREAQRQLRQAAEENPPAR